MPTYPIINRTTGEQKEITLSLDDWEKFKKENIEWSRDWSDPSTAPSSCEIGEWRDTLIKKHPGWNDVLHKVSKSPKSLVRKI